MEREISTIYLFDQSHMKQRTFCLILILLIPVSFCSAWLNQYEPAVNNIISLSSQIALGIIFLISILILAINLAISCVINLFKKAGLNSLLIISIIGLSITFGYFISKMRLTRYILKKAVSDKVANQVCYQINKIVKITLLVVACAAVACRIIFEIVLYFCNRREALRLAVANHVL
jgi:uncharacterized membrane protein